MEKVTAYKCPGGILETDPIRAYAWKLHKESKKHLGNGDYNLAIEFSAALWIIDNKDKVKALLNEFEKEISS